MVDGNPQLSGKAQSTDDASIRLGGITIYAKSERILQSAVQHASETICRHVAAHLSLTRTNIRSKVRDELAEAIDDRVFSALLGLQLRLGRIDVITCAAESGKAFHVLVHESRIAQFQENVESALARLDRDRVVVVKDLEKTIFGSRKWGTWSSASHVLAHLVFVGSAVYLDGMSFASVSELDNALR